MTPDDSGGKRRRQAFSESVIAVSLGLHPGWQTNVPPGVEPSRMLEIRNTDGSLAGSVSGGALTSNEMDVLTWSLAQALLQEGGRRGVIRTTLTQIARAMYGYDRKISRSDRKRVQVALTNLWNIELGLRSVRRGKDGKELPLADMTVKRRFLQEFQYGAELEALQQGVEVSPEILGSLRDETLVYRVADWLLEELEEEHRRALLNWHVQRSLGAGMAKRLWVYVECLEGYEPVDLLGELECLELALTDDVYSALGANCRERYDNRKAIKRGLERILEIDDTRYVRPSDEQPVGCELLLGRRKELDVLRVVRHRLAPEELALAA